MSVFKVKFNRGHGSGVVSDTSLSSGVSLQKTMDVPGPRGIRRTLKDGETFTSSNYWLRYASTAEGGTMSNEDAFVQVISNDGSPWSDSNPSLNQFVRVSDLTVVAGTTFSATANQVDILGTHGGVATATEIVTDEDIRVRFNSSTAAEFALATGSQSFDHGEVPLTSLAFSNNASGATDATVQVLMTIQIQTND